MSVRVRVSVRARVRVCVYLPILLCVCTHARASVRACTPVCARSGQAQPVPARPPTRPSKSTSTSVLASLHLCLYLIGSAANDETSLDSEVVHRRKESHSTCKRTVCFMDACANMRARVCVHTCKNKCVRACVLT